jgi:16S rRNA (cytosine967-C5)-methyltransferase
MSAASPAQIRAAAARWVAAVVANGRSLDQLLADDRDEGAARGLKRTLAYGTLRWHFRLQALLRELTTRRLREIHPELAALIEIGLYQLEYREVAEHAAVAETVNAARELGHARAAGFVNAILRRFQRERDPIVARVDRDPAVRTAHPPWLVSAYRKDWPEAAERMLQADNEPPPFWLRVNRTRATRDECIAMLGRAGFTCETDADAQDALRVTPHADVRKVPGFAEGQLSVQDAAAQLAVDVLAPSCGERILDACAAPGGKASHILERTGNGAALLALDVSAARLERVTQNFGRLGLTGAVIAGDALRPATWWDGQPFDAVLLDAPCSGTGVIRRHPDIRILRRAADIAPLAATQSALLEALWPLVRPGGRLLYTTCSVLRAENQQVIQQFLARHADARDGTSARTAGWAPRPAEDPGYQRWTGDAAMDGFYYACLDKREKRPE